MYIEGKAWGSTSILLQTPVVEIRSLVVLPNAYCSLHMHSIKNNSFFVFRGTLFIEVHKNSYDLVDRTELREGDLTTVMPGEYHRFVGGPTGAHVLEIYHLEPLSEDIMRKDKGGPGVVDDDSEEMEALRKTDEIRDLA
jgi:mannose-6-phosphate isomerase-like protein (cupin superfamily)